MKPKKINKLWDTKLKRNPCQRHSAWRGSRWENKKKKKKTDEKGEEVKRIYGGCPHQRSFRVPEQIKKSRNQRSTEGKGRASSETRNWTESISREYLSDSQKTGGSEKKNIRKIKLERKGKKSCTMKSIMVPGACKWLVGDQWRGRQEKAEAEAGRSRV